MKTKPVVGIIMGSNSVGGGVACRVALVLSPITDGPDMRAALDAAVSTYPQRFVSTS